MTPVAVVGMPWVPGTYLTNTTMFMVPSCPVRR
jgi:hypothetical protein